MSSAKNVQERQKQTTESFLKVKASDYQESSPSLKKGTSSPNDAQAAINGPGFLRTISLGQSNVDPTNLHLMK